jgi:hypothetical protein
MKLQSSKDDTAGFSNPTTLQSPYFPAVKNDDEVISGSVDYIRTRGVGSADQEKD